MVGRRSLRDLVPPYDSLSQLLSVTQMGRSGGPPRRIAPKGVGFAYNLDGQFTSALRFDPTTASPHPDIALGTFSYDTAGRLASLAYTHLGNPIDSFGYQYDPLDRVSQFSSIDGTANYGYDKTSQLTSVVYTGGGHQPANESFQYDPNGNQTGPSPAGPNFTVGTDNLLASDGTFNLFYDAEGNLIEKKRISTAPANDFDTKQSWDYRNRLTDVWQYNNSGVLTQHEHMVYDPFDRLIGRYIDSTGSGVFDHTELYVYDGSDVVLQFDGTGSLTNRYLNGPSPSGADQVYAEEDVTSLTSQGAVTWPLTDQQGSPHDIVDSNSVLEDHLIFKAFGQTAYESNAAVHHLEGFAGGLPDSVTGEIHFGARNLNAVDAVFTAQDPKGFGGGDTNLSRYTGNSPTNYTDPTGLAPGGEFNDDGELVGIGGTAVSPKNPANDGFGDQAIPLKLRLAMERKENITYAGTMNTPNGPRGVYFIEHADGSVDQVIGPVSSKDVLSIRAAAGARAKATDKALGVAETVCKVGSKVGDAADVAIVVVTGGIGTPLVGAKKAAIKGVVARNVTGQTICKITAGQTRVAKFGRFWQKADVDKAIARHAGPNATSWRTASGKTIFENPRTGRQVVVDDAGYFRIFQPKSIGSKDGKYLDMLGKVPSPARRVKSGNIKNVPLTGGEFEESTHFLIE